MTNSDYLVKAEHASFSSYVKTPSIYKCPSDSVPLAGSTAPRVRSYAMNLYLSPNASGSTYLNAGYKVFRQTSDISAMKPSMLFVFQDVHPNNQCFPAFVMTMNSDSFFHFPSSQHNKRGVLAFADSHVETHRWIDKRTMPAVGSTIVGHGITSSTNVDLIWLRRRTTLQ
jgi:hypothetical protein